MNWLHFESYSNFMHTRTHPRNRGHIQLVNGCRIMFVKDNYVSWRISEKPVSKALSLFPKFDICFLSVIFNYFRVSDLRPTKANLRDGRRGPDPEIRVLKTWNPEMQNLKKFISRNTEIEKYIPGSCIDQSPDPRLKNNWSRSPEKGLASL